MLADLPMDVFLYFLTFMPKNRCAVCSSLILSWEIPYLTVQCSYNDTPNRNGKYLFCSKECSAHANLPQREKMIKETS